MASPGLRTRPPERAAENGLNGNGVQKMHADDVKDNDLGL
jgi:hypothetical protein